MSNGRRVVSVRNGFVRICLKVDGDHDDVAISKSWPSSPVVKRIDSTGTVFLHKKKTRLPTHTIPLHQPMYEDMT
jgi:hypothetical protein